MAAVVVQGGPLRRPRLDLLDQIGRDLRLEALVDGPGLRRRSRLVTCGPCGETFVQRVGDALEVGPQQGASLL